MEELLIDNKFLNINLIDSIDILGLSVETLHSKFLYRTAYQRRKVCSP